jgi:DNA-binding protein HU-beta
VNKAQLVEKIAAETKTTKAHSEAVLDATLDVIQAAVSKGEEVKLVGFGTFSRANRKARTGRNPQTGETVKIPATKVPKFRPGKEFKESIN